MNMENIFETTTQDSMNQCPLVTLVEFGMILWSLVQARIYHAIHVA